MIVYTGVGESIKIATIGRELLPIGNGEIYVRLRDTVPVCVFSLWDFLSRVLFPKSS